MSPRRHGVIARPSRRGYTLIELLLVIAVLGLAGAILIPSMSQTDTLRIQAAVRMIIGDLAFAHSDALAQQEYRRVFFFEDGNGYVLLRSPFDPESDAIYDPLSRTGAYVVRFDLDERLRGVTIESVAIDGEERFISFDELGGTVTDGNAPGTGGSIIVRSPNARYEILIAPFTGKMSVRELALE